MEGLEVLCDLDRSNRIETAMHFDEDVEVRADGVADSFDERDGFHPLFTLELIETCAKRIEFRGPVTALHDFAGGFGEFFRRTLHRIPAVRVGLHFGPN